MSWGQKRSWGYEENTLNPWKRKNSGNAKTAFYYTLFIVHTKFQRLTLNFDRRKGRWKTGSVLIQNSILEAAHGPTFGTQRFKLCEKPHTGICLTEEKWVDSILFHFFTGLRWYNVVSWRSFFHEKAQTSIKKTMWGHFFLIQHTSVVLYAKFQTTTLTGVTYRVWYGRYLRPV